MYVPSQCNDSILFTQIYLNEKKILLKNRLSCCFSKLQSRVLLDIYLRLSAQSPTCQSTRKVQLAVIYNCWTVLGQNSMACFEPRSAEWEDHPSWQPLLQRYPHPGKGEQFGCGEPSPNPLIVGKPWQSHPGCERFPSLAQIIQDWEVLVSWWSPGHKSNSSMDHFNIFCSKGINHVPIFMVVS